jgi:hypothetical protein
MMATGSRESRNPTRRARLFPFRVFYYTHSRHKTGRLTRMGGALPGRQPLVGISRP